MTKSAGISAHLVSYAQGCTQHLGATLKPVELARFIDGAYGHLTNNNQVGRLAI